MPITLLPTPPSRQDPVNFNTRADEFLGALPAFGTEANALATDVNTKQTQAAASAINAASSATNAANSAIAAATSATNASGSASSASTSATNAANSATLAAANSVLNKFTFSTTTTMVDPGVGFVRFNNTTLSSVTAIALDAQTADSGNPNILNVLLTHDDSTSAVKGYLKFTKAGTPSTFVVFTISSLTNNTAWVQYAVAHVASSGTFANNDAVVMEFSRTGDAGTGDVTTTATQTLTNKTLTAPVLTNPIINDGYTEEVYSASTSGSVALTLTNGSIQVITHTGAITFTDSIATGQSMLLGLTPGANTTTWPTITWTKVGGSGTAPTLTATGVNWIVLWKINTTLRGAFLGTA